MYIFRTAAVFIVLIAVAFVCGCQNNSPQPVAEKKVPAFGGTYHRAFADSFLVLDPALIKDSNSHEVCRQIYDGLVEFDEHANVLPAIAREWKISDDKLVYTFFLRGDVRFHAIAGRRKTLNGGRKVDAEDVVYSFARLLKPQVDSQASFFWVIKGARDFTEGKAAEISGIRILASDTVEFTLEKPFAPFVSLLAMCNGAIVPREDAECTGGLLSLPVGTGPFAWVEKASDTIILEANADYYRGRPYLDRLEFLVIEDEVARFNAFLAGKLQQVDVPDSRYRNVKQDHKLAPYLLEAAMWGTNYLGMNVNVPPFNDVMVRKALNYALDRETIVRLVLNDRAQIAHGVLPPGIPGYNFELAGYTYDLEKAREYLAKAGYPDGKGFPEITLQYNRDAIHVRTAEFVLANLRDIGIKCVGQELEFGEHLKNIETGKAHFFRLGWTVDYPDPDNFLYTLFHSSNIHSGYNFSGLASEKLDKILDQARFETEMHTREKLYQQAEQLIVDEAPWVFLYFYTSHLLHAPEVNGLLLGPMGESLLHYRHIWLQKNSRTDVADG
jgi:peptide/nickel transport system substrate-binding protein/oligopeptide transport system substrate-binding protein